MFRPQKGNSGDGIMATIIGTFKFSSDNHHSQAAAKLQAEFGYPTYKTWERYSNLIRLYADIPNLAKAIKIIEAFGGVKY